MKNDDIFDENFEKKPKITSFPLIFWISFENHQIRQNLSGNSIIFDPEFRNPCVMTHSIARFFSLSDSLWFPRKINKNSKNQNIRRKSRISRICALKSQFFHSDPLGTLFTSIIKTRRSYKNLDPSEFGKIQKKPQIPGGKPRFWHFIYLHFEKHSSLRAFFSKSSAKIA